MKTLGERIRLFRERASLTQSQLGNLVGLSFRVISKWENNISAPDVFTLKKLSKILNFSIDEILNENFKYDTVDKCERIIDVLDVDQQKTGQTATYEEVHAKGLWHQEVSAWIGNKKGQYLITRRSENKIIHAGLWAIAAGHVYSGESELQALTRIIEHELNIVPSLYNFKYLITEKQKNEGKHYRYFKSGIEDQRTTTVINKRFEENYILRLDIPAEKINFNTNEISEIKWVTLNQLEQLIKAGKTVFSYNESTKRMLEDLNIDLLDIVDADNNLTGKVEEKQEVHERGLWHREALVFIGNHKMQLLGYKRVATTSVNPGVVVPMFGGHVLAGESYEDGAKRELEEETGLSNKKLTFLMQTKVIERGKLGVINKRHTNYYFCVSDKRIGAFKFPKSEIDGAFWLDFQEAKRIALDGDKSNKILLEPKEELYAKVEQELKKINKAN